MPQHLLGMLPQVFYRAVYAFQEDELQVEKLKNIQMKINIIRKKRFFIGFSSLKIMN
jgi:hypothetical protein